MAATSMQDAPAIRPPERSDGLCPGSRIGPYEIAEFLGAGGMGEVYRAHDLNLDCGAGRPGDPGTITVATSGYGRCSTFRVRRRSPGKDAGVRGVFNNIEVKPPPRT